MSETVVIVDYGAGNLRSAANALRRVARDIAGAPEVVVSADPDVVARCDRVVLPGVGAFADCMAGLKAIVGMAAAIDHVAIGRARPFLGICVGMQLMARLGKEHGEHRGLDWIGGEVVPLGERGDPAGRALKIPHIGWNTLDFDDQAHPVVANLPDRPHVYFVHSYHFAADDRAQVLAETDYGGPVTAVIGRNNLIGTQFHPEKSQAVGLAILRNFLDWRP